mgnify:FL=1
MKVTDKTLVLVGLLAFFVSLGCVSFVLVELGGVDGITGFATTNTTYGYVNVTVLGSVAVTLVQDTVEFGSGALGSGTKYVNSSNLNSGNPSGFSKPGPFHLRNDGNVYVNVTVNGSDATEFFGVPGQVYKYGMESGNDGALVTVCGNYSGGSNDRDRWNYAESNSSQIGVAFSSGETHDTLCPNMSYSAGTDELNVSIFLEITNDTGNGTYEDKLEFMVISLEHS